MSTATDVSEQTQYVSFFIAEEEYAIAVLQVKEILEYNTLTRVPNTPRSVLGVINLRGRVVPVVDLAVKFGLPESKVTKRTCIVIVEVSLSSERAVMGVLADSVSQVIDLQPAEIEAPPPFGTHVQVEYLRGMSKSGRKFLLLLDIDAVLSADELSVASSLVQEETDEESASKPRRRPRRKNSLGDAEQEATEQKTGAMNTPDSAPPRSPAASATTARAETRSRTRGSTNAEGVR